FKIFTLSKRQIYAFKFFGRSIEGHEEIIILKCLSETSNFKFDDCLREIVDFKVDKRFEYTIEYEAWQKSKTCKVRNFSRPEEFIECEPPLDLQGNKSAKEE
uniref:Uncharacterized protein n=1 Tax=Romanomermis culicivorax TaxID=13658 RepID=A0A915L9H5_ROMCU